MTDFKVEKPVIFISHASSDKPIVEILKTQIDKVFANGVNVFASSIEGVIRPGSTWLNSVNDNLAVAKVVLVLITPVSINRPWVWFELGATWAKKDEGKLKIYPLYVPEIQPNDLPRPLSDLQATPLGSDNHVKLFFQELCDLFDIGNMRSFRSSAITHRLPKYSDIKVDPKDLESGTIYSGPFEGYSDIELSEVIDDYLHDLLADTTSRLLETINNGRNSIFSRQMIHYREFDKRLNLPPGTTKKLLKGVAQKYELVPEMEYENCVRFKKVD